MLAKQYVLIYNMSRFPNHVTWKSYQLKASILAGEVIQFFFLYEDVFFISIIRP